MIFLLTNLYSHIFEVIFKGTVTSVNDFFFCKTYIHNLFGLTVKGAVNKNLYSQTFWLTFKGVS